MALLARKGLLYESRSLPADVLWGSFVTHFIFISFLSVGEKLMRDKRTPKDVCGEVTKAEEVGSWSISNKYFFYPHVGDYMGRNGGLTDWRTDGMEE